MVSVVIKPNKYKKAVKSLKKNFLSKFNMDDIGVTQVQTSHNGNSYCEESYTLNGVGKLSIINNCNFTFVQDEAIIGKTYEELFLSSFIKFDRIVHIDNVTGTFTKGEQIDMEKMYR